MATLNFNIVNPLHDYFWKLVTGLRQGLMARGLNALKIMTCTVLITASTLSMACTCGFQDVESVAHINDLVFSKLKVTTPPLIERFRTFLSPPSELQIFNVQVIENFKDAFTSNTISMDSHVGRGGCGTKIEYGDTINIVAYKDAEGVTSNGVSICNTYSNAFAEKVREQLLNPNTIFKPVDIGNWRQFHRHDNQIFYADAKRVTKDEYGSYIWVLMNDGASKVKSQKTKLQISCEKKLFTVSHEIRFSDYNANGKVVATKNFDGYNHYRWLPLTDVYSKLLSYAC